MACCILAGLLFGTVLSVSRAIRGRLGHRKDPLDWRLEP